MVSVQRIVMAVKQHRPLVPQVGRLRWNGQHRTYGATMDAEQVVGMSVGSIDPVFG
jgi:hypothetical protein